MAKSNPLSFNLTYIIFPNREKKFYFELLEENISDKDNLHFYPNLLNFINCYFTEQNENEEKQELLIKIIDNNKTDMLVEILPFCTKVEKIIAFEKIATDKKIEMMIEYLPHFSIEDKDERKQLSFSFSQMYSFIPLNRKDPKKQRKGKKKANIKLLEKATKKWVEGTDVENTFKTSANGDESDATDEGKPKLEYEIYRNLPDWDMFYAINNVAFEYIGEEKIITSFNLRISFLQTYKNDSSVKEHLISDQERYEEHQNQIYSLRNEYNQSFQINGNTPSVQQIKSRLDNEEMDQFMDRTYSLLFWFAIKIPNYFDKEFALYGNRTTNFTKEIEIIKMEPRQFSNVLYLLRYEIVTFEREKDNLKVLEPYLESTSNPDLIQSHVNWQVSMGDLKLYISRRHKLFDFLQLIYNKLLKI